MQQILIDPLLAVQHELLTDQQEPMELKITGLRQTALPPTDPLMEVLLLVVQIEVIQHLLVDTAVIDHLHQVHSLIGLQTHLVDMEITEAPLAILELQPINLTVIITVIALILTTGLGKQVFQEQITVVIQAIEVPQLPAALRVEMEEVSLVEVEVVVAEEVSLAEVEVAEEEVVVKV